MGKPPHRAPTRADVARLSGVSTAVVSYVLNSGPKTVSPATKEKVLDAVRALGYRPNAAARALSGGAANMYGMLVGDTRNPFSAQLCYSVDKAAGNSGRSLLLVNCDNGVASQSERLRELAARQVNGLISMRRMGTADLEMVASFGIPLVLVNQAQAPDGVTSVGVDYQAGAFQAVAHLLGHGHESVAFVGSEDPLDRRERGWAEALAAAGKPLGPRILTDYSLRGGYDAGLRLDAGPDMPSAVFAASDQIGIGLLAALHDRGLSIPGDVAVVAFDGIAEAEFSWPPLTTVAQPIEQVAELALAALEGGAAARQSVVLPTQLIVRRSCGCLP